MTSDKIEKYISQQYVLSSKVCILVTENKYGKENNVNISKKEVGINNICKDARFHNSTITSESANNFSSTENIVNTNNTEYVEETKVNEIDEISSNVSNYRGKHKNSIKVQSNVHEANKSLSVSQFRYLIEDDLSDFANENDEQGEGVVNDSEMTIDEDFSTLYDKYVEFEREQSQELNNKLEEVHSVAQKIWETVKENNNNININKLAKQKGDVWKKPWEKDTCLIIGDSTIHGLEEHRMGGKFKVRGHSGAIIADLYHHIIPLIPKNPKYIVIMIGTNDARNKTANEIMLEIKDLKLFIGEILPESEFIISCPTKRTDHRKAGSVVFDLRKKMINLKLP